MNTVSTIADLRTALAEARGRGLKIGLVPTMGFLHEGHLALIKASERQCDLTVVSIFVNPTQFAPNEDFRTYPRDLERDEDLCRKEGVAFVFAPDATEVYREDAETFVDVGRLGDILCGAFRPGHFRGVATVVTKLFNIVQPDVAYFGQKDLQQCVVVQRLVRDLDLPLEIVVVPTVREPDGLAMSSRNKYLDADQRRRAGCISRGLSAARDAYGNGERDASRLRTIVVETLVEVDEIQYVDVVDLATLAPIAGEVDRPGAICVAAYIGKTRLIDNMMIADEHSSP